MRKPRRIFCERRHQRQGGRQRRDQEVLSNGPTEGQITKLKLVKGQMYGRAKLDLLQARLIGTT
ncbi:transposase [Bradyrhizobium sp. LB11.1]|jgi:transposase